ncbi:MAG: GNAT family N-acetyltransferase [Pseudonocardia sp.]|nr:GNAT family N-acetyltransferase [Pseudonocardia sp.]
MTVPHEIVPVVPGRLWHALEDDEVVGRAHLLHRPDGRRFLGVDAWRPVTFDRLVRAVLADVPHDLHSRVDAHDGETLDGLARHGFSVARREDDVLVRTAVPDPPAPFVVPILPATDVPAARLAALDRALREDGPDGDGWADEARRPYLLTHLVAVDDRTGDLVGLARIWRGTQLPRLGVVGVTRSHRGCGLGRALLEAAFMPLAKDGVARVTAEVDASNPAGQALLRGFGAVRTGGSVEMHRPH